MKKFPKLENLRLSGATITDAAMAELREISSLRRLSFSSTAITDVGMGYLKECSGLKSLEIHSGDITDIGLKYLGELKNLESLYLRAGKGTGEWLIVLKELRNLKRLTLHGVLTDNGLYVVDITESTRQYTAKDMQCLRENTELEELDFFNIEVDAEAAEQLAKMTDLKALGLWWTSITNEDAQKLNEALPGTKFSSEPGGYFCPTSMRSRQK